jgi:hypothetical protein
MPDQHVTLALEAGRPLGLKDRARRRRHSLFLRVAALELRAVRDSRDENDLSDSKDEAPDAKARNAHDGRRLYEAPSIGNASRRARTAVASPPRSQIAVAPIASASTSNSTDPVKYASARLNDRSIVPAGDRLSK